MRDYRDAKAMAHLLREELAAKHFKITVGEGLELVARLFGAGDWNTLSALIKHAPAEPASAPGRPGNLQFATTTEEALHRSLAAASERAQSVATVEHLLLSLTDDPDATDIMKACGVVPATVRESLLRSAEIGTPGDHRDMQDPSPSPTFQRAVQRAILGIQKSGGGPITGADLLIAIFSEEETTAVRILHEQGMHRRDALRAAGRAG